MMLTEKFRYRLKMQIEQVHYFSPAVNDGVVVIGLRELGKDAIYHFDAEAKLVFEHNFEDLVDSMAMMTQSEVMVPLVKKNEIFILDLNTHQVRYYKYHYFFIGVQAQVTIETFLESGLICIRENGSFGDHRLKLTYYRHPLPLHKAKEGRNIVSVFESKENEWTYEHSLRKGNNHSMILWFRARQDDHIELRLFDLYDLDFQSGMVEGNYRELRIKNTLGAEYKVGKINCAIVEAW
jgi:hypothetical protein